MVLMKLLVVEPCAIRDAYRLAQPSFDDFRALVWVSINRTSADSSSLAYFMETLGW